MTNGVPSASDEDLGKIGEETLKHNEESIEHVHEYIKTRMNLLGEKNNERFEGLALKALEGDKLRNNKVY